MKRKWLVLTAGLSIGALMVVASNIEATAGSTGYEAYKAALRNVHTIDGGAGRASVSVTDNGNSLLAVEAQLQANRAQQAAHADVKVSDGTRTHEVEVNRQDGKTIVKRDDSDVYYAIEGAGPQQNDKRWSRTDSGHSGMGDMAEHVVDALFGQLKNQVTLTTDADGSKQVSLHLSGGQVPLLANTIAAMAVKKVGEHANGGGTTQSDETTGQQVTTSDSPWPGGKPPFVPGDLQVEMPKLTDGISVKAINLDAAIDADGALESQTAELIVTGRDAAGNTHEVKVKLNVELTDHNVAQVEAIDLTGKTVQSVRVDNGAGKWHGRR